MHLISLLVTSTVIFLAFLPYCARLFPLWSERISSAALLATLDVILVQIALGITGNLTRGFTVGVSVLLSLVFLFITLFRIRKLPPPPPRSARKTRVFSPGLIVSLFSVAFAYSLITLLSAITPPYSWDSLTYHLTATLTWVTEKKLVIPHFPGAPVWYPMNGELLTLWTFFAGGPKAVNFTQLPYSILAGIACYDIARRLGFGRHSFYTFLLFAGTPVVMIQSLTQYNDVVFGALFLLSLLFLIGFLSTGFRRYLLFFAISFGLFLGTKAMALYAWIPLVIVLAAGISVRRSLGRVFLKFLPVALIAVIVSGGFFYLRNFILTGNIVFPVTVKLLGKTIMPGLIEHLPGELQESWFVKKSSEWFFYPLFESFHGKNVYSIENGFGMQFLLGLISLPLSFLLALRRKEKILATLLLTAIPVTLLMWFTVHPYREPRYLISICGISALSLVYLVHQMPGLERKVVTLLIVFATLVSTFLTIPQLVPREREVLSRFLKAKAFSSYDYYIAEYGGLGEGWKWIDEHTKDGDLVAITYSELTSPLFGETGMKRVKYFPSQGTSFPNLKASASPLQWPTLLYENGAKFLFLWEPSFSRGASSLEKAAAESNPDVFRKEASWEGNAFGNLTIYSVGKPVVNEGTAPGVAVKKEDGIWYPVPTEYGKISVVPFGEIHDLRYSFASGSPGGYVEIETKLMQNDISLFKTLSFEIEKGDFRDLLQVFLKGENAREQQRHYINLSEVAPGWREMSLDLTRPGFETKQFDSRDVRSLSFVFVQSPQGGQAERKVRLRNLIFR